MHTDDDVDIDDSDPPWTDDGQTEPNRFEDLAEEFNADAESMAEQLDRDKWLDEQDVATTLVVGCERVVGVDTTTEDDHIHVWTDIDVRPAELARTDDLNGLVEWNELTYTILSDTEYRVANKYLLEPPDEIDVDANHVLVMGLEPDDDVTEQFD